MRRREENAPETKRLLLGSAFSRADAAPEGGGGMNVEVVEKSRLKPRGAATAALMAMTITGLS